MRDDPPSRSLLERDQPQQEWYLRYGSAAHPGRAQRAHDAPPGQRVRAPDAQGRTGWAVGADHLMLHLQNDTWSLVSG